MFFRVYATQPAFVHDSPRYRWDYRQGTEKNPGRVIAESPASFNTVAAARSDIAAARRAFGGARMAKVVE